MQYVRNCNMSHRLKRDISQRNLIYRNSISQIVMQFHKSTAI